MNNASKKNEPVITVYADGLVLPGPGYSIGDVLSALDAARRAVLGIVLRQPEAEATPPSKTDPVEPAQETA